MWICSQFGFFSIVEKRDGKIHVRARAKKDLRLLKRVCSIKGKIQVDRRADYQFRIFVDRNTLRLIMRVLAETLNYDNFKNRIYELPDQRDKLTYYHDIWLTMLGYQMRGTDAEPSLVPRRPEEETTRPT